MDIVLFGPPGAGKGTHAEMISKALSIPHISTGDIFRAHIKGNTELGQKVKSYTVKGNLVPDETVFEVVASRLTDADATSGVLYDGYPRTIPQVELLLDWLKQNGRRLDFAININVPTEEVVARLTGRRSCLNCGASYHTQFKPPSQDGSCLKCSSKVIQRKDDQSDTVQERIRIYNEQTFPVLEALNNVTEVINIDGVGSIRDVADRILHQLEVWNTLKA
jgi:adenylate kinase